MSLISDALKKVQQQRERSEPAAAPGPSVPSSASLLGRRLAIYGGALAALLVVVLLVNSWVGRNAGSSSMQLSRRPRGGAASPGATPPAGRALSPVAPAGPESTAGSSSAAAAPEGPGVSHRQPLRAADAPPAPLPPRSAKRPAARQQPTAKTATAVTAAPAVPVNDDARLLDEGRELLGRGEAQLAFEKFRQALAARPSPAVYVAVYSALQALGNDVLSLTYMQQAVAAFPADRQLQQILVNLNIRARRFGEALARIEAIGADNAALLTYRGLCRFHLGDLDRAQADFQASLLADAAAVENHYYIGLIHDNRKEFPRALEQYRRFLDLNPPGRFFRHRQWILQRIELLQGALSTPGRCP